MKKLSLNDNQVHPKLLLELNKFISEQGNFSNHRNEASELMDKLDEIQKLFKTQQFRKIREDINQILDKINGWNPPSSLDPMID